MCCSPLGLAASIPHGALFRKISYARNLRSVESVFLAGEIPKAWCTANRANKAMS